MISENLKKNYLQILPERLVWCNLYNTWVEIFFFQQIYHNNYFHWEFKKLFGFLRFLTPLEIAIMLVSLLLSPCLIYWLTVLFLKYKKQDHDMAWLSSILESIWFFFVIQVSFTFLWPPPLLLKIWIKLFSELFQHPCTSNRHLLVQSQWGKHQKKMRNLFK